MKLNEKIIYLRKKAGMSQIDLADELGVSRQTVSKWETGESNPEITKLPQLAKTFDVTVDWLLSEEEPVTQKEASSAPKQTASGQHYPEWLNRLPKVTLPLVKKYGWIVGVYYALIGIVPLVMSFILGAVSSAMGPAKNKLVVGNAEFYVSPGFFGDAYNEMGIMGDSFNRMDHVGRTIFSVLSGVTGIMGVALIVFGVFLAVSLKKWGNKE